MLKECPIPPAMASARCGKWIVRVGDLYGQSLPDPLWWRGESPKGTHDHFPQRKLGPQEVFVRPDYERREPAKTVLRGLSC
jgi:hypothetical protein